MWLSDICKCKCSNAKVPPWRFLMKISPFTTWISINHIFANLKELEGISTKDVYTKTYFMS
jgi:hypothetical protein